MTGSAAAHPHGQPWPPDHGEAARVALVERSEPWRLAAQALGAARAGTGSVLMLEGPSGMGRSALIAAIGALAREAGMRVLTAAGRRRERDFRFGVILQLLESELPGAGTAGDWDWSMEPSFDELHGFYRRCRELSVTAPLALLVDDADLADDASLRSLLYLTERAEELPTAIVLASGSMPTSRMPPLLRDITRHRTTVRVRLDPLTARGTERRLAKRWPIDVLDAAAVDIHRLSGGNPFLADTLAAALAERGGSSAMSLGELAAAPVAEWVTARAEDAGPAAPALVSAIAVLGAGCERRHVSALTGIDIESATDALDQLADIGVLTRGERLSFAHPVVAEAIETALAPGERGAAHLHAAEVLSAEDAPPEQVATQLQSAARTGSGWVVDALCRAAKVALARGAPHSAVRYLRRALDEPPSRARRIHVILELGHAEAIAGDPRAAERLSNVVRGVGNGLEQPGAALKAGRVLFALGRLKEALVAFDKGLEQTSGADPDLTARLLAGRDAARWLAGLASGRRAPLRPVPVNTGAPGASALLALHAVDKAIRGESRDEVLDLALAALADGRLPNDETSDGVSYYLAAAAMAYAEELERAEAALTTAVQDAESRGSVLGLATASHLRSLTNLMRGRLADAAADARNVLAVQKHGWLLGLSKAHAVLATVACEQGDLERAAAHIDDAQSGMPADAYRPALLAARGRLQLCRGETEQARDSFRECGELAERAGVTNPAVIAWRADLGVATAVIGDWNEGKRLIEDELARARAFGAPGPIGRALRALASIHAPQLGLEILHDAVETLETSQAEAERAAALIDFGAALRRSGRRRDAISPLREGLHLARHCGAAVLVERAVRETTAAGARPRRSALYGEAALTERELQVAALAADGLSNREIADTLVVTVKTVEWHLRHVYEKLGIRSRRELAATLEPGQRSPG